MAAMKRPALTACCVVSHVPLVQSSRTGQRRAGGSEHRRRSRAHLSGRAAAIVEGESVALQAWVSTAEGRPISQPIVFAWEVDAGRVEAQAATTKWDLSSVKVSPEPERRAVATVKVTTTGKGDLTCAVQVFIGQKAAALPDRGTVQAESLLSGRHYLLPGDLESPGYGLYSYLLFSSPPRTGEE